MADLSSEELSLRQKAGAADGVTLILLRQPGRRRALQKAARPARSGSLAWSLSCLQMWADRLPQCGKINVGFVVSEAKPIIADYHFTTLTPVLGVVRMGEGQSFVMADIPGLIEGASEGVGLGHEFLRHVERCRLLVHIVDVSGSEGRDPIEDFEKINQELAAFNPELAQRPQIVAGNKCDLAEDDQLARFASYIRGKGYDYYPMSAAHLLWNKRAYRRCGSAPAYAAARQTL